MSTPSGIALVLLALVGHAAAKEDRREVAREHFRRGTAQYTLNHYDVAILEFEAGYAESPEPAFLFNLAQAHGKLGHTRLALDFYRKYLDYGALPQDVPLVREKIERLTREIEAAEAPATVNLPPKEVPAPPPVDPAPVAAPPRALEVTAPPAPAVKRTWAIGVGIAAAVALIAVVVGLSVGLSQAREPEALWSVH